MRIAFLVEEFPALSETFVLDQITGLLDLGADVDVYANRLLPGVPTHSDVARYSLMDRAYEMAPPMVPSRRARIVRGVIDVMRSAWTAPATIARTLNPVRFGLEGASLKVFYRALPFLKAAPYDVLHCHFGPNGNRALLLRLAGVSRAPLVTQFHGYDASSYVRQHGADVYRGLFAKGDSFLCVSDRIRSRLVALGCPPDKVQVHRVGIDVPSIAFEERREHPELHVLTVGRLVEKKGIEFGIRALSRVVSRHPRVRYRIVGDGPLRDPLRAIVRDLGLEGVVEFLGGKSRSEVQQLIRDADVLLAPSVCASDGDEEGIPVILMEAMAAGLPVVSTRHAGIPELVADGQTGLLADEKDPEGLAEHVLFLADRVAERRELARAGRRFVEQHHDGKALNAALLAIYRRLARPAGAAAGGEC
jgi:colanic acid/amylovoran biosynthesis glycosyltransferase